MASEVDICNLALAHLGDEASVASISPPDGSSQADHCARFYPIARAEMLDLYPWSFTLVRTELNLLVTGPKFGWDYAYAAPNAFVSLLGVHMPEDSDDFNPQPFDFEALADGTNVIYSNTAGAICRYSMIVTDTSKYQPLFVNALSYLLASKLAGPIIKGDNGMQRAQQLRAYFDRVALPQATSSDASQRRVDPRKDNPLSQASWIKAR